MIENIFYEPNAIATIELLLRRTACTFGNSTQHRANSLHKYQKQKGARFYSRSFNIIRVIHEFNSCYSSSSKVIASLAVCNSSYSSFEPTIMFSNSRKPVPAGIK
jgi:hypothetical protein